MQLCDGNLDVSAHDSLNSPGTVTSHEAISDVMMPDTCSHHVMNAAARVIMNLSLRDHVKPALKQLHWLPVELRIITYKPCLFMYHIHTGQAPQYLSDCVSAGSALSGRYRLRSTGSADYVLLQQRTRFGERGFSYCGPAAWNTLPSDLHDITDTGTFRKRLKSVLYDRAYH